MWETLLNDWCQTHGTHSSVPQLSLEASVGSGILADDWGRQLMWAGENWVCWSYTWCSRRVGEVPDVEALELLEYR